MSVRKPARTAASGADVVDRTAPRRDLAHDPRSQAMTPAAVEPARRRIRQRARAHGRSRSRPGRRSGRAGPGCAARPGRGREWARDGSGRCPGRRSHLPATAGSAARDPRARSRRDGGAPPRRPAAAAAHAWRAGARLRSRASRVTCASRSSPPASAVTSSPAPSRAPTSSARGAAKPAVSRALPMLNARRARAAPGGG